MDLDTRRLKKAAAQESSDAYSENILPKGAILQNRYEIIKVLGVGGMGAVYLSQDLRFTGVVRMCAIKEMVSSTPDPHIRRMAVQSFEREANLMVQLSHAGIPQIYDFFTESIRTYLVMEFVDGQDLEEYLESTEGMLKESTILEWALQVCEVLIYLHSQDPPIVFRDMKPSNIMLRKGNNITLIDFGIAKAFASGQKGTMIGTEGYSPPEQYKGITDPRGDIYALGATLHHLLTKRDPRLEAPFTFHEEPPRLLNPALSQKTNDVIMRALEYDMNKRYQTAKEFKIDLAAALNNEAPSQAQDEVGTRVLPTSGRPANASPDTAYISPSQAQQPPAQQPQQPPYPQQPYPPQGYPPPYPQQPYPPQGYPPPYPQQPYPPQAYPPDPNRPMNTAGLMGEGSYETPGDSILPVWKFKCEDEVRSSPMVDNDIIYIGSYDNNVYALDLKKGDFVWKYATDGGIATRPAIYEDGLIFGSEDMLAYAVTKKGRLSWTCPTEGRVRSSAAVAFGHAFFGSDDHKFYAVNAKTGRIIWKYETMGPVRSSPTIGHDMVYFGSDDGYLYAADMSSGKIRWKFRATRAITSSPRLHEGLILVGSFDSKLYAVDAKTGYMQWQLRTGQAIISSPVVHDGRIYIGSTDKHVYAVDAHNGRVHWKYNADSPVVSTPAVTDEAVYFGNMAGEVISIARKDKKVRWRFKTEKPVPSSPLVLDGVLYVGSIDHHLYALPA